MGEKYKLCEFCDLGDYATIGNTCTEYMKKGQFIDTIVFWEAIFLLICSHTDGHTYKVL